MAGVTINFPSIALGEGCKSRYKIDANAKNYVDANYSCKDKNNTLINIINLSDWNSFSTSLLEDKDCTFAPIGLTQGITGLRWSNGTVLTSSQEFLSSQIKFIDAEKSCAVAYKDGKSIKLAMMNC